MQEARFANDEPEAERTGVTYFDVRPGQRTPFGGSGRMKLDGEIIEVAALDAIRVAPAVVRAFEAGEGGLQLLAVGARHDGDGELVHGWWPD